MSQKEETIIEHLTELRRRLIYILIFFSCSFLLAFLFASDVYQFLTSQFTVKLVVLGPNDILWIYMTLSSLMALTVSLPFMAYQIWAYIKPALEPKEAKFIILYIPSVFICFILGLIFGFFVVTPALLEVLLKLGDGLFNTQLTAQNYITFVFHTTIPIAVIFEFPVIMAFLTSIGLISSRFLIQYRRYAYFILIVLAVVLTPADLFSDLTLFIPLLFIYEIGIVISKMIERKKEKIHGIS